MNSGPTRDPAKAKREREIAAETAAFLAAGGKIEQCGHGETVGHEKPYTITSAKPKGAK